MLGMGEAEGQQRLHMSIVQSVVGHSASTADGHDPISAQEPQRMTYGGLRHACRRGEVADAEFAGVEQAGQQPQPTRLAEQGEYLSALVDRCFRRHSATCSRDLARIHQPDAVVVDDRLAHAPPHQRLHDCSDMKILAWISVDTVHIILIPGFWLDGSSWAEIVPVLEQAGHRPQPLTLPGMESREDDRSRISLRDHVDAVVAIIDSVHPAAGEVVLVGHSGGGAIAHAAVDARPGRVVHVVHVDTWPVGDGGVINDRLPAENGEIPLPDWSHFEQEDLVDLTDELRATFRARAIPTPERVARDAQQLFDEHRYAIPVTVIACAFPSAQLREWMAQGEEELQELAKVRTVDYIDLPTGHWPQFTRPMELGRAILTAVNEPSGY